MNKNLFDAEIEDLPVRFSQDGADSPIDEVAVAHLSMNLEFREFPDRWAWCLV